MNQELETQPPEWEIFCQVVDNFGDIGVCWRLARDLAVRSVDGVRLWVDDWLALARICPQALQLDGATGGVVEGVELRHWQSRFPQIEPGRVVIEAFACELPPIHLQAMLHQQPRPVWINLEYLSAEDWVAGCHALASPHPHLPLVKYFYFPGFDERTGGLLRELDLLQRRDAFRHDPVRRSAWFARHGVTLQDDALCASLFAYEQAALPALMRVWAAGSQPLDLLVPEGRILGDVCRALDRPTLKVGDRAQVGRLAVHVLPFTDQDGYDELLWACDLNFVRGEDSFVRAQWAGLPFVWQIYAQDDDAHLDKLEAFMARYLLRLDTHAARALTAFWLSWNGRGDPALAWPAFAAALPALSCHAADWSDGLSAQTDLVSRLTKFCSHKMAVAR
ncbi:MAG TPA: elongation factor P maturation arginine rhamnosyltransferase EarP [Thauera sp.]|nr:elongation factor P maturation arginine rhamnosyltransferase EarP [Thauera sp.]HRA81186.1 elongation factor P maturation arginine rhamnosyltransferase EarP [Thauera sp.]